MCIRAAPG